MKCYRQCKVLILTGMVAIIMVIIPPRLTALNYFHDGLAAISVNGKIGYINKNGAWVIKPRFKMPNPDFLEGPGTQPYYFHEGLACVMANGKCGYINKKGTFVIKPAYTHALRFSEGLAAVMVKGKWGFINTSGVMVVDAVYDDDTYVSLNLDFRKGLSWTKLKGKWGMIDREGDTVLSHRFDRVDHPYSRRYATVFMQKRIGMVDPRKGTVVVEPLYESIDYYKGDIFCVKKSGKWGLIDKQGKTILDIKYASIDTFHEGRARVLLDGKFGYVNDSGRVVVKPRFDDARQFHEGLAAVKTGTLWGFIDESGDVAIQPAYKGVTGFSRGKAFVLRWGNGQKYYEQIDRKGNATKRTFGHPYLEDMKRFNDEGLFIVTVNIPASQFHYQRTGKGLVNLDCKVVLPIEYDQIDEPSYYGLHYIWKVRYPADYGTTFIPGMVQLMGLINSKGKILFHCRPTFITRNGKTFGFPQYSNIIVDKEFIHLYQPHYPKGDTFGLADHNGTIILKPIYDSIGGFSEGLAPVVLNGRLGFINKKGTFVIPRKFKAPPPGKTGV